MAKLSKFPVTTPEGNEYCVTLIECEPEHFIGPHMEARVYVERKRRLFGIFRFKRISREVFWKNDGYNPAAPYYVSFARIAVERYEEWLASEIRKGKEAAEARINRTEALAVFEAWDGRIINEKETV